MEIHPGDSRGTRRRHFDYMFRPFDAFRRKAVGEPLGACGRNLHGRVLRNRRQGQTVGGRKHLCYAGVCIVLDLLCIFEYLFGNSDYRLSSKSISIYGSMPTTTSVVPITSGFDFSFTSTVPLNELFSSEKKQLFLNAPNFPE